MARQELDFNPYRGDAPKREWVVGSIGHGAAYVILKSDYDRWAPWMRDPSLLPKKPPGRK